MPFLAPFAPLGAALVLAVSSPQSAHIHGKVVTIDRLHHRFFIHHEPFAEMPMAMTMEVRPRRPGDIAKLHVGETIDLTVDLTSDPWVGTEIRAAKP